MEELLQEADEFQEILSRNYSLPNEIDENDLEAELDALTDELLEREVEGMDSYLDDITTIPSESVPVVTKSTMVNLKFSIFSTMLIDKFLFLGTRYTCW